MLSWLFGKRKQPDNEYGRAGAWPRVRREHLEREPACVACGRSKDLEVHHVIPYHERPELELDPENLITLCATPCHFVHGHLLNWKSSNVHVRKDAARYRSRMLECGVTPED